MINSTAELAGNIANLCRICSAPGSHTIYAKIPPYLHEHPRECPRWTMPISRLLTEVTGLDSSEVDGLPQKICVVCISYLKHAYTFPTMWPHCWPPGIWSHDRRTMVPPKRTWTIRSNRS
uniref:(northern house mosquito) hypothetical protein n=1 Tax=Culex pipiens TaxID=7175 RepID=A0A8D8A3L9_CULPI